MSDFVAAIDQGTTGTTAMLLDRRAAVRGKAYAEFTQHYPQPGWVEHDAVEIWEVTRRVAEQAIGDAGLSGRD